MLRTGRKPYFENAIKFAGPVLAEPAKLVRSSELRTKPFIDAPVQMTLAEGAVVDLLSNEGGWSHIKIED